MEVRGHTSVQNLILHREKTISQMSLHDRAPHTFWISSYIIFSLVASAAATVASRSLTKVLSPSLHPSPAPLGSFMISLPVNVWLNFYTVCALNLFSNEAFSKRPSLTASSKTAIPLPTFYLLPCLIFIYYTLCYPCIKIFFYFPILP